MITTNTGAKKIENSDNWREIFDAHNTSVDAADRIQPEVAPIINGKQCALSVAVGNFVLLRNSTISGKADGAYEVTKAIPANTNLDSTYIANNPIGGGIANELNNNITSLNDHIENSDNYLKSFFTNGAISTDLNTTTIMFCLLNSWATIPNAPSGLPEGYHMFMQIWEYRDDIGTANHNRNQLIVASNGKVFTRRFNGSSWSAWATIN